MPLPPWVPGPTARLVAQTVDALGVAFGDALVSAVLVGNAMNPASPRRGRAPEVLAIVRDGALRDLPAIARALHKPMSAGARVRIVTADELRASCDVFALEVAEWRARHHVLRGAEPFADLRWTPADMRRSLEEALRGLSRRVRNRVLAGLAAERDDPREAVLDALDRFVVVAHHALELLGERPPADEAALVAAFCKRAGADPAALLDHLSLARAGTGRAFAPLEAMGALHAVLGPCERMVDAHEVAA